MKRPQIRPGDVALAVLVAWELICPPGETVCDAVERRAHNKWVRRLLVGYTAFHVAGAMPTKIDGLHALAMLVRLQDKEAVE